MEPCFLVLINQQDNCKQQINLNDVKEIFITKKRKAIYMKYINRMIIKLEAPCRLVKQCNLY